MLIHLPKIVFLVKTKPIIETDFDINKVLCVALWVVAFQLALGGFYVRIKFAKESLVELIDHIADHGWLPTCADFVVGDINCLYFAEHSLAIEHTFKIWRLPLIRFGNKGHFRRTERLSQVVIGRCFTENIEKLLPAVAFLIPTCQIRGCLALKRLPGDGIETSQFSFPESERLKTTLILQKIIEGLKIGVGMKRIVKKIL